MLADVETLDRRKQRVEKKVRSGDAKAAKELAVVQKLVDLLNKGEWLGNHPFTAEERAILNDCQLLSAKPILFIANAAEGAGEDDPLVRPVKELADKRRARLVILYGQLEAEISTLPIEDRAEFMKEAGLTESGLVRLTKTAYELLGLITFFTAGEVESRAWAIRKGLKASEAAGKIHSDMERGFIRAEVYHYDELVACGSEAKVREKGLFRLEGRDYIIKEGDVVYFRFNV
jgi:GTP-binding protein YchF